MFNPEPRVELLPLIDDQVCLVIDDALLEPQRWVDYAVERRADFAKAPFNAYPGLEFHLPPELSARLEDYFRLHARQRLQVRRTLQMYSRLSLVTLTPPQLAPIQWLCHRDRFGVPPGQRALASVAYLFRDASLGGTSFFRPRRAAAETEALMRHAASARDTAATAEGFSAATGVQRGYLTESNDWFERVCTVPARWNRLIFYDGSLFHSPDIRAPERLNDDPTTGRLTLNGFFTCSRQST